VPATRLIEFFTVNIRNRKTRPPMRAWRNGPSRGRQRRALEHHEIETATVAGYIEQLGKTVSKPAVAASVWSETRMGAKASAHDGF
jgi:hypothetical protein